MPSIEQSLRSKMNLQGYEPAEPKPPIPATASPVPTRSRFTRCPVPPIGALSPDNIDQFNLDGAIPQYRIFIKSPLRSVHG